jgi:hypothetical protein
MPDELDIAWGALTADTVTDSRDDCVVPSRHSPGRHFHVVDCERAEDRYSPRKMLDGAVPNDAWEQDSKAISAEEKGIARRPFRQRTY